MFMCRATKDGGREDNNDGYRFTEGSDLLPRYKETNTANIIRAFPDLTLFTIPETSDYCPAVHRPLDRIPKYYATSVIALSRYFSKTRINDQQSHPYQLPSPTVPLALRNLSRGSGQRPLPVPHTGHMAIYRVLDPDILCDRASLGSCVGGGYAMSELENLLDFSADIRGDRELGSSYNREHYRFSVSSYRNQGTFDIAQGV